MALAYFITHPDVLIDPSVPVPAWRLSPRGLKRMQTLLQAPWVSGLKRVFSSTEQKALDGARILAEAIGRGSDAIAALGENDRSSTGYLPLDEFEAAADHFFAKPTESVRGWERAIDAQTRIVAALGEVRRRTPSDDDLAVISHGAVGALLLAHLERRPISRGLEQPATNGGNYFAFERGSGRLIHGWRSIDGPWVCRTGASGCRPA